MFGNQYPFIAKEGWYFLLLIASILAIVLYYLFSTVIAILTTVFFLLCLFIFRDPKRVVPSIPLAVVSPIQGKIIDIVEAVDPWLKRKTLKIRIKMSIFDVYSLFSPIEGKLMEQWSKKDSEEKTQRICAFWIRTDEGDDVVMALHLNFFTLICFRIYAQSGERLGQGQRCGYLCFGGTIVDIYVPSNSRINLPAGQAVVSGENVIACLLH